MELQIFIHIVNVVEYILYNARNNPLIEMIIEITLKENIVTVKLRKPQTLRITWGKFIVVGPIRGKVKPQEKTTNHKLK